MLSAIERRMEIVNRVNQQGKVRVEDLAVQFKVSTVTIRTDLNYLEQKAFIVRSHGFAIPSTGLIAELSVQEKRHHNLGVKSLIAVEAATHIENGDMIILDSGTTTCEIATLLKQKTDLVVMTNGLDVAMELSGSAGIDVLMTGGALRKQAMSFSGSQAEKTLANYRFNKVFLGVDGFDVHAGITTHNEQEASLNRLMCDISEQIIAVCDSTKFGKRSCHMIREFGHINMLITDSGIPKEYLSHLQEMKVDVIIVNKENK